MDTNEVVKDFELPNFSYTSSILRGCLQDARTSILDIFQKLPAVMWNEPMHGPSPMWLLNNLAYYQEEYLLRPLGEYALEPKFEFDRYINDTNDIDQFKEQDFENTWNRLKSLNQYLDNYLSTKVTDSHDTRLVLNAVFYEDRLAELLATYLNSAGCAYPKKDYDSFGIGGKPKGDVDIPGGFYKPGVTTAEAHKSFYYDNEISNRAIEVKPFSISKAAVTNGEFLEFVLVGGYLRSDYWSYEGLRWLVEQEIKQPHHFENVDGVWYEKSFNEVHKLRENNPIINISWFEAEAFCNWKKRRLPTEVEWEIAAATQPERDSFSQSKSKFTWGNTPIKNFHGNLSWVNPGTLPVGNFPKSDSSWGLAQMIGNCWEWTASSFLPYAGYDVDQLDPNYSIQHFGKARVARGGSFATRSRLIRNSYREALSPTNYQAFVGFRTCKLQ